MYLAASDSTIGMVLVQEDECFQEHAIYYHSRALEENELSYAHVERLALATVHATQILRHYITLRKNYGIANMNPFQYILSRHMIGCKFAKWIVIL